MDPYEFSFDIFRFAIQTYVLSRILHMILALIKYNFNYLQIKFEGGTAVRSIIIVYP